MSIPAFDVGDLLRIGNQAGSNADGSARDPFRDAAGVATDPDAVTLSVRGPDGTTLVYGYPSAGTNGTLTREDTGRYYFDLAVTASGMWSWKLAGTGAVTAAEEDSFYVRSSRF